MKKKIIISSIVIVAILPMLFFGGILPFSAHSFVMSPVMQYEELMEKSEIVVRGEIVDSQVNVKFFNEKLQLGPEMTTTWTLKVDDMIKGDSSKEIEFVTEGGKYNNMVHRVTGGVEVEVGDKLIIFLHKDTSSIWGNNYYVAGVQSGVYEIDNNTVTNEPLKKSFDKSDFERKLKNNKYANP